VLVVAFFVAVAAAATLLTVDGGATPIEIGSAAVVVLASTAAVAAALRYDRARVARLTRTIAEGTERGRVLFDVSPDPMWVWDADTLAILDVNEAATRFLGWSRDDLLRMSVAELQVDASPRQLRSTPYEGAWRHRRRDGSVVSTMVATSSIVHAGRSARVSLVQDLTAEQDSDARTRAIVDNAADAILTIDIDGIIESANPAAERMFGHPASELVNLPVTGPRRAGGVRGSHSAGGGSASGRPTSQRGA
jgi:PAS domain S-box-containing protein